MRQTLFYIPSHLAGMPIFGVGLLLLVWGLLSLGLLALLARQGRLKEELTGYLVILVPMGLAIVYLLPLLSETRGLPIRSYGMMMLVAVVSGTALAAWRAKRAGYEPDLIYSLAFWTFIPGIMGARAFYVIEYWGDKYWPIYEIYGLQAFLGALVNIAEGGLVVYGSFFGAAAGFLVFVRKYKLPVLLLGDLVAPSLMLGLALGRVGCLLNGCCYGGPCEHSWAVTFPAGSPPHVHQAQRGQIPLQGITVEPDSAGRPAVAKVAPGLLADGAKLATGDVLRQINGMAVDTVDSARWALLDAPKLSLTILSENDSLAYWLMELPPLPTEVLHAAPDGRLTLFGMVLAETSGGHVMVAGAAPRTPAAKQGIRAGQRIVAVNGRPVHALAEFRDRLGEFRREPWIEVRTANNKFARWPLAIPPARSLPVHPTQLYSVINATVLFLLLLAYGPFQRRDGELIAITVTLYAISRFLIEDIRTDEAPVFFTGLSISQNVSLILLAAITVLWFYILRQPRKA